MRCLLASIVGQVLILAVGCVLPVDPCSSIDADDGDPCTIDQCGVADGAAVVSHTPVQCGDKVCEPSSGTCVDCTAAEHCDDANPCTMDSCEQSACRHAEITGCCTSNESCDDGDLCTNEICAANRCVRTPTSCGDGDPCTVDVCQAGGCSSSPIDCDDADACTVDSCQSESGECRHVALCGVGEVCDSGSGECLTIVECVTHQDCPDDGFFCNGAERCDLAGGVCVHTGDPCASAEPCNPDYCLEDLDACSSCPPGVACDPFFGLTLDMDQFQGSMCDDQIPAPLLFNPPTGTNRPSLQSGDVIDGGGGIDALQAQFDAQATDITIAPTVTAVEHLTITDFGAPGGGATVLSAAGFAGLMRIQSIGSLDDRVAVTGVNNLVDLGVTNTASDLRVSWAPSATAMQNDAIALTVQSAMPGCTVELATAANGIETLTIVSEGDNPSVLDALTQLGGLSLIQLSFSGSQDLDIRGALDDSIRIIDAHLLEAELMVSAGAASVVITAGTQGGVFTGSMAADIIQGGPGGDTLRGRGGSDSNVPGAGIDTVEYVQPDDGGAVGANQVGADLIHGFAVGSGGDVLAFERGAFFVAGSTLDLDIISGSPSGSDIKGFTDGGANAAQVVVQTTRLADFDAVATLFSTLDAVATTTRLMVIAEVTGAGAFVAYDGESGTPGGERVLAQLIGLSGAELDEFTPTNFRLTGN